MTMSERPASPRDPRPLPTSVRAVAPAERAAETLRQLRTLSARGLELALAQEAGQAATPFTEALRELSADDDGHGLTAVLIGLDPDAVSQVIAWLLGHDHHLCKVVVPERVGFAELVLQERGYVLEHQDSRREFDGMEAFLDALRDADVVQDGNPDGWMNPLLLSLASPDGRRGLRLLIPNGLGALQRRPALVSLLADRAALVLVAGRRDQAIPATAVEPLTTLLSQVPACLPLNVSADADASGAPAWLSGLRSGALLPTLALERDGARLQSLLFERDSQLRLLVVQASRRRRLDEVVSLLLHQAEQTATSLANRLRLGEESPAEHNRLGELREHTETVRTAVASDIAALRRDREQNARQALRVEGDAWRAVELAASSLSEQDILRTKRGSLDDLSLRPETLARLQALLETAAKRLLAVDLELVRDSLSATCEQAAAAMTRITSTGHTLAPPAIDPARLWESLTAIVRPEIRYRGEIARATFFSRLSAARRQIMVISMLAMMLGGTARLFAGAEQSQTLRNLLYASMLPLLVIGILWTYVRGNRDESERMAKEVERLRETVGTECRRLMSELQREKGVVLMQLLGDAERTLGGETERVLSAWDESRRGERERERSMQQVRNRNLEQRLKEIQRGRGDIERLHRETRELDRVFRDWSSDLATQLRSAT